MQGSHMSITTGIQRFSFWQREFGLLEALLATQRRVVPSRGPFLAHLLKSDFLLTSDSREAVAHLASDPNFPKTLDSGTDFGAVADEYVMLNDVDEVPTTRGFYPDNYDIARSAAAFLYVLVRAMRPRLVLETGIARGQSSLAILRALEWNNEGSLVSVDPDPSAGCLVPEGLRSRWVRPSLKGRTARQDFKRIVRDYRGFEIFLHDSNHRPGWMKFELSEAGSNAANGAVLCSDDVQQNKVFSNLARGGGARVIVTGRGKALGAFVSRDND